MNGIVNKTKAIRYPDLAMKLTSYALVRYVKIFLVSSRYMTHSRGSFLQVGDSKSASVVSFERRPLLAIVLTVPNEIEDWKD